MYPPGTKLWNGFPSTSNINVTGPGQTVANQVIVPVGNDRRVTIFAERGGHVIVDVFGYVTGTGAPASTSGLFVPLASPSRMLDTRSGNNPLGSGKRMWNGWTVEVPVGGRAGIPRSNVAMVVGNITYVDSHNWGWITGYAAGQLDPGTSNVNAFRAGQVVPNHATIPVSPRGVALSSSAGGHLLLDVSGYYLGPPRQATYVAPLNTTPPPQWPVTLSVPALGLTTTVFGDTRDATLRSGVGWWPGTAYPGLTGNMAIFGHRTECAPFPVCGPFHGLDRLRPGDRITVSGDRRIAVYEVVDAAGGDPWNGFTVVPADAVRPWLASAGRNELTLIACSRPDGSVSSLSHRIIVRARMISYSNA
jgi:LPXTG-site transpeptidase (sortase) family protein